jgi:signal transduction histidine kinase
MATTATALLLAAAEWITYDTLQARDELQRRVTTIAQIIADNSTAALAFNDPDAAVDTLDSVRAEPFIVSACVYSNDGLFAHYPREDKNVCPIAVGPVGYVFEDNSLSVFTPIVLDGETIGRVHIRTTLEPIRTRLRLEIATIGAILVITALFAFWLSSRLQKLISSPILSLANTARAISDRRDYSIRATKESDDELGMLARTFNEMLTQIQARDRDLIQANLELESRVEQRTQELESELAERRRTEAALAKKNEELATSNRELDDFAYIASHDLKEPLRGMHNYSSFLLEDYSDKIDDEGRRRLQTLIRLSQRMEHLIDSLLDYSRVGRVEMAMEPANLNDMVADVVDSLQIRLSENNVKIRIPKQLPTVVCDRVRVTEVFRNLITNAMKYNVNPEKWIEIGFIQANHRPVLYVRDNGIGIPSKHYQAIFRIFKRLHVRDKYGGGSGAGLTIVRKIVERHEGRIWVDSVVNEGTTFYFTLEGDN